MAWRIGAAKIKQQASAAAMAHQHQRDICSTGSSEKPYGSSSMA